MKPAADEKKRTNPKKKTMSGMKSFDVGDCVCVEGEGERSSVVTRRHPDGTVDVVTGTGKLRSNLSADRLRLVVPLDDMPRLSNARRVLRLAMVLDEVRAICKLYARNTAGEIRPRISAEEFHELGGSAVHGKEYSFYRQLVYAKRDAKAFSQRMSFPKSLQVQQAHNVYKFYPSDLEDVEDLDAKGPMKRQDAFCIARIALVLKRFRVFMKKHGSAPLSDAARSDFDAMRLTKHEFVRCGGFGTVTSKADYSFYRQVVYAKRDIELILHRGHFGKGRLDFTFGLLWRLCEQEPVCKSDCLQNDDLLAALAKQRKVTPSECVFTTAEWNSFHQANLLPKNYLKVDDNAWYFPVVGGDNMSTGEDDSDDSDCLRALDSQTDGNDVFMETTPDGLEDFEDDSSEAGGDGGGGRDGV